MTETAILDTLEQHLSDDAVYYDRVCMRGLSPVHYAKRSYAMEILDKIRTLRSLTSDSTSDGVNNNAKLAPRRNCDVGTADEQMKRQYDTMCNTTKACPDPDWSCRECFAKWAQLPYKKGGGNGNA